MSLHRDHFVYEPSQWEMTLQCNVISHWLGAFTKWFPITALPHEHRDVSNHQQLNHLFNSLFRLTPKQTSKHHIAALLWGKPTCHQWVDSPHKWPVMLKVVILTQSSLHRNIYEKQETWHIIISFTMNAANMSPTTDTQGSNHLDCFIVLMPAISVVQGDCERV